MRVEGCGLRVQSLGTGVEGAGLRLWGLGCRVALRKDVFVANSTNAIFPPGVAARRTLLICRVCEEIVSIQKTSWS